MKKRWIRGVKGYLAFLGRGYKLVMFLLMPLAALGMAALIACIKGQAAAGMFPETDMAAAALLLLAAEVYMDRWTFGSIAARKGGGVEYLKTSPRGLETVRAALWAEKGRMLFEYLAVFGLCKALQRGISGGSWGAWGLQAIVQAAALVTAEYCVAVCFKQIARYFDDLHLNSLLTAMAGMVFILLINALRAFGTYVLLGLFLLAFPATIVSIRLTTARVEEDYYDQKV